MGQTRVRRPERARCGASSPAASRAVDRDVVVDDQEEGIVALCVHDGGWSNARAAAIPSRPRGARLGGRGATPPRAVGVAGRAPEGATRALAPSVDLRA